MPLHESADEQEACEDFHALNIERELSDLLMALVLELNAALEPSAYSKLADRVVNVYDAYLEARNR